MDFLSGARVLNKKKECIWNSSTFLSQRGPSPGAELTEITLMFELLPLCQLYSCTTKMRKVADPQETVHASKTVDCLAVAKPVSFSKPLKELFLDKPERHVSIRIAISISLPLGPHTEQISLRYSPKKQLNQKMGRFPMFYQLFSTWSVFFST